MRVLAARSLQHSCDNILFMVNVAVLLHFSLSQYKTCDQVTTAFTFYTYSVRW